MKTLRIEASVAGTLERLRLSAPVLEALRSRAPAASTPWGDDVRVDLRAGAKGAVVFLNNLEKDAKYKEWPADVGSLLKQSWNLHSIRKNLYTCIVGVDPTSLEGRRVSLLPL